MKKKTEKTESPLEKQAQKRFLSQITGLDLNHQDSDSSSFRKLLNKFKNIF